MLTPDPKHLPTWRTNPPQTNWKMRILPLIQRELLKKEAVVKIHIRAVKIWNLEIHLLKVLQVVVSYIRGITMNKSKNRLLLN